MYRVMIVDDEVAIREKIPQLINFEEYGFTVCATAKNGKEALEKLPEVQPDLIFLDVRMPVLDGLGFLEQLRKGPFSETSVIILSGYSDFEYARKAMLFGAKGYLTKPIDEDDAHACLKERALELAAHQKERTRMLLRRQIDRLKGLYNSIGAAEGFADYALLFVVVLSSQLEYEEESAYHVIGECMEEELGMGDLLLRARGSVYTYLLPLEFLQTHREESFGRRLIESLAKHHLDCTVLLDMDMFQHPEESYRLQYAKHLHLMLTEVFFGRTGLIRYTNGLKSEKVELVAADSFLANLRNLLMTQPRGSVSKELQLLIAEVKKAHLPMEYLQELNYRIYYLLLDVLSSVMTEKQEQEPILQPPEWRDYPSFLTVERWEMLQKQQMMDAFDFIERCRKMSHMGVCGEVLDYVHRHFQQQLSIKQVAEQFFMNPAYLGRVFQKATGVSFSQYINDLRIAEAKRLLRQTDKLVYEIAELTGFSESKYFVVKFTKTVGQSPSEYRKQRS